jgi:3-oxoacid CoA-transferase
MDKVYESPEKAIADLEDGASIALSSFGPSAGSPASLLTALYERGNRSLTFVGNGIPPMAGPIVEAGRVRHLIMSFTARGGQGSPTDRLLTGGDMTFELVPQGTLVERMRAGGAGLGAIYTPTALNTQIADGKELRYFDGKPYLLETAIRVDYAFVAAHRADRLGNVEFRGANRHLGPSFAKAARIAVVEVDEIVEPGAIPPERIDLPGIFVARVVRKTVPNTLPKYRDRRPADVSHEYDGKSGWTRMQVAEIAAGMLPEPAYVNLGLGIPSYVSSFITDRDITLQGENGILGYGEIVEDEDQYPDVFNASGLPVTPLPGISYFDSVTSFEMLRSGRVDVVVLGAYQVDAEGSIANWALPGRIGGGIGGAMDLVASGRTVMVLMDHRDAHGRAKLLQRCTYPLTGKACVDIVVTDLGVFRRTERGFVIESVAPGFTPEEVWALTEMDVPSEGVRGGVRGGEFVGAVPAGETERGTR